MCFSASASFTAAAVLVPIGIYGTHIARTTDQKAYAPLAMTPAFFGTQQFVEGLQWTAIDNGGLEPLGSITARGFLFFAYCFWMIWIPFCAYSISKATETEAMQKRLKWVWIIASILGIGFYIPVFFQPMLVQPAIEAGRIVYNVDTVWHHFVNTEPVGQLVYWGFIVLPLVALKDKGVKMFGGLIFISIFLTWFTHSQAFNSVWCFYCAVLSIFILWIINRPRLKHA